MSADVVTLGEALVALVADEGRPLASPGAFTPFVAGAEANVAMGLARLDRSVAFVGRVGADGLGRMVRTVLRGEGVDVSCLSDDPGAPTGALARDRRSFPHTEVVYLRRGSAASQLDTGRRRRGGRPDRRCALAAPDGHHACALGELPRCGGERARSSPAPVIVRVSLDVNLRRRLWSDREAAPVLRDMAERCDLVIAGEEEAALLCGEPDAALLAERFGVEAVVTHGERGATGCRAGDVAEVAGLDVTAVDVVGAGDAFTAGYLDALLDGASLVDALRRANACGAVAVSAVGDATGLPTRSELERVLAGGGRRRPDRVSRREGRNRRWRCRGALLGLRAAARRRRGRAARAQRARARRLRGQHGLDLADDLHAARSARRPAHGAALGLRSAWRARHPPRARHGLAALAVGLPCRQRATALPQAA